MPVIVWLHGGGYAAGSAIEHIAYDGFNMCMNGDAVVVSINHRLNILGYLDLSPFGEKYKNSGNAGHADMVAALKWIHDNISLFGGDPENVTVFGQSGGGMKVADLMQIEEADGLFHRGFIMSGVSDASLLPPCTGDGREIVTQMLKELGISENEVEKLETVPYYELVHAYEKVSPAVAAQGGYIGGSPLVNDYFKGNPLDYGFRQHAYEIPILVGSVFGEFAFSPSPYNKNELTKEQRQEIVGAVYGEHADEMIELFQETFPGKNPTDLLLVDRILREPSKNLVRLYVKGGEWALTCMSLHWNFLFTITRSHGIALISRSSSIIRNWWKYARSRMWVKNWKPRCLRHLCHLQEPESRKVISCPNGSR